jgi:hypothetical protein
MLVEPFLISEARFWALLHRWYGLPVAARHLALLAGLMGAAETRQWLIPPRVLPTPGTVGAGADPVDTFLTAARLGDERTRRSALCYLACRLYDPRVIELRRGFEQKARDADPTVAKAALQALAHLRDKNAVPAIADLVESSDEAIAAAALETLRALTCADFGRKCKSWLDFWTERGSQSRIEWLLDGLAHKTAKIRLLASNELYQVCGEYFGYHYDLPERERQEARQRWMAWWHGQGKAMTEAISSAGRPQSPLW